MRLDVTYPHPEQQIIQELLADGSEDLKAECIDRGTTCMLTHDNATGTWVDRKVLKGFLVAEHIKDLTAELAGYAPAVPAVLSPSLERS